MLQHGCSSRCPPTSGAFHLRRLAGNVASKLGKRLFTLPQPPGGDVLSINDNSGNAGDTGFAG